MADYLNVKDMLEYPEGGVLSKVLFRKSMDVTLFCMSANTSISEHTSTKQGSVYIIEGKGTFVLEGKEIPMSSGVIIYMEKNAKHSLRAESNTSFLLMLSE